MDLEKLLCSSTDILDDVRKSQFVLFIRAHQMQVVGIMTKIDYRFDSGWGQMRPWAVGLTLDKKRFEEPLNRKNRRTGEFEDLIQMKNELLLVTARKTEDPDDDNDDNFQYFFNPNYMNMVKDQYDRINEKDRVAGDLLRKLEESESLRDYHQKEAEANGSNLHSLKERVSILSRQAAESAQQVEYYRAELKKSHIATLEREGALDEKIKTARDRGTFGAKDSGDVIIDAAKKQTKAHEEMHKAGFGTAEGATRQDLTEVESNLLTKISEIAKPSPSKEEVKT